MPTGSDEVESSFVILAAAAMQPPSMITFYWPVYFYNLSRSRSFSFESLTCSRHSI